MATGPPLHASMLEFLMGGDRDSTVVVQLLENHRMCKPLAVCAQVSAFVRACVSVAHTAASDSSCGLCCCHASACTAARTAPVNAARARAKTCLYKSTLPCFAVSRCVSHRAHERRDVTCSYHCEPSVCIRMCRLSSGASCSKPWRHRTRLSCLHSTCRVTRG